MRPCRLIALALVHLLSSAHLIGATPEISLEQPAGVPLETGTVAGWGTYDTPMVPIPEGLVGIREVTAGEAFTLALKNDGTVVGWGENSDGQTNAPAGLGGVISISAGSAHALALKSDGTVVAWGRNGHGQTNVPAGLSGVVAIAAGGSHSVALKSDGTVVLWGFSSSSSLKVPAGLSGVTAIAAGSTHTLAVKNDGTVVAWGMDNDGSTSVPAGLTGVRSVAGGFSHSVALKQDGTVVAWGNSAEGITTVPSGLSGVRSIAAGRYHSLALKTDGTVVAWGDNVYLQTKVPAGLSGVRSIAAGIYHSAVVRDSLVAYGNPVNGVTSSSRTFVIRNTGSAALEIGGLTLSGEDAASFSINSTGTASSIEPGGQTSFVVNLTPGGDSRQATLSISSNDADEGLFRIRLTSSRGVPEMVVERPAGVPLVIGTVTASGANTLNQTKIPPGLDGLTEISARGYHTLALRGDGGVVAWGYNFYGQATVPAGLSGVAAVAAGGSHSLALKKDGTVVAWGYGVEGQTNVPAGLGGVVAIAAGDSHSMALKNDGTVTTWGNIGVAVPAGLNTIKAIAAGGTSSGGGFAVALKNDGTVVAWGNNSSGQTDVPAGLSGVTAIAAGGEHALALKSDGTVIAWGRSSTVPATVPAGLTDVKSISAGHSNSVAIKRDGTIVSWVGNRTPGVTPPSGATAVQSIQYGLDFTVSLKIPRVSFGNHPVGGTSQPETFSIRNTGTDVLTISNVAPVGDEAGDFIVSAAPFPVTIPMGGVFSFDVSFSPSSVGTRVTKLAITGNDADEPVSLISLTGTSIPDIAVFAADNTAPAGELADNTGVTAFPDVPVSSGTASRTFTILNNGVAALNGLSVALSGTHAADFSTTGPLVTSLAPGASTTFTVSYDPSVYGKRFVTISIASNDPDENPFEIQVAGAASPPAITVTPPGKERMIGWGINNYAQTAVPVAGESDVREIAVGDRHTIVLRNDGTLFGWGSNHGGQTDIPAGLGPVRAIAAGLAYTVALKEDGKVVGWGSNFQGQLTIPTLSGITAIAAGVNHAMALRSDGTVVLWGSGDARVNPPSQGATNIKAIATGYYHNLVLKTNGTVVAWGKPFTSETSVPSGLADVVAISAGDKHSVALKSNGTVVAWGNNTYGQTAVPAGLTGVVSISAGRNHTVALKSNGEIVTWGSDASGQVTVPSGLRGVKYIKAGDGNTFAVGHLSVDFGNVPYASAGSGRTLVVKNTGNDVLKINSIGTVGGNMDEFTVAGITAPVEIPVGGELPLDVLFSPVSNGYKETTIRFLTNDPDDATFDLLVSGTGFLGLEKWRQIHFNEQAGTAAAGNLADFDGDGLVNLLEYAFATDPNGNTPAEHRPHATTGTTGFSLAYRRPVGGIPGVGYIVEQGASDLASWQPMVAGVDYTEVISANGDGTETVVVTLKGGLAGSRFVRIRISL